MASFLSKLRPQFHLPNPHSTPSSRTSASIRYLTSDAARRAGLLILCVMISVGLIAAAASSPLYSSTVVFWISAMLIVKMMIPIFILLRLQRADGASRLQLDEELGYPREGS
jgi:hypothetical protein